MDSGCPESDGGPKLRKGLGAALAIELHLPLLLLFWFPWFAVGVGLGVNCLIWAGGLLLLERSSWWRTTLFVQDHPRLRNTKPIAIWMMILGLGGLIATFMDPR